MGTAVEKEIAAWMLEQFESRKGYLAQSLVEHYVRQTYGPELLVRNRNGNWGLSKGILQEFRKLTPENVVWSRGRQVWRRRNPTDKPGRMVR